MVGKIEITQTRWNEMNELTAMYDGASQMNRETEYERSLELVELARMTVKMQRNHQELVELHKEMVNGKHIHLELLDLPEKAARRQHNHRKAVEKVLDEVEEGQMKYLTGQNEINRMFY